MTLATYTGNIPNRLSGATTFSADVDYYHAYFTPFIAQFNADVAALNLNSVTDTSTTSNTIGTGAKTFTVSVNKSFQAGQYLIIADTAAPSTNSMAVQVTSYNSGTGALVVDSKVAVGSGTKTAWVISLTAAPLVGQAGRATLDIKQLQSIDYSLSANSLTLKLNPTNLDFRSTTASSGTPTNVVAASQLTTVISPGSTGGSVSGISSDILLLAINNAGTMELAWTNATNPYVFDETGLITTTAEGGAGAADSATVIYSTTARTNVAYRVVGLFRSTQTTAGTWVQTPSLVQGAGFAALGTQIKRSVLDSALPAFSAIRTGSNQSVTSAAFSKVQCQTEDYDLTANYDNSTLYRFTPNVAGIYAVNVAAGCFASSGLTRAIVTIHKNGAEYKRGTDTAIAGGLVGNAQMFLNGTTDYIEMYVYIVATTPIIDQNSTYFQAALMIQRAV